jgi:hypothetical protein
VPERGAGRCVAAGRIVLDHTITGILTLRPRVFAEELAQIAPGDRDYVAAEMTAALLAWLAGRRSPVLNAPCGAALAGPNWRPPRWRHAAKLLGIPMAPADEPPDDGSLDVVTVGERCFGAPDAALAAWTVALARAAGTELIGCRFSADGRFLSASPWPALDRREVRDALAERLGGRR